MSDGIIFHLLFLIYLTLYILLLFILNFIFTFPLVVTRVSSFPGAWFWTGAATKAKQRWRVTETIAKHHIHL